MTKATVTPRGRLRFPAIHRADAFEDQAPKYKADIIVPDNEAFRVFEAKCRELLDKEMESQRASGRKVSQSPNGWPISEDSDGETPTGNYKINCRQKAQWPSGDPRPSPRVYGPDNNLFSEEVHHGAEAQVAVEPYVWTKAGKVGLNLTPIRVRVYKNGEPRGVSDAELDGLEWDDAGDASAVGVTDSDGGEW